MIAGQDRPGSGLGAAAGDFAEQAGYPLLADPLSDARQGVAAIATYDLLLRDEAFTGAMAPELIIRVGDLPTSKPLRTWLAGLAATEQISLGPEAAGQDPAAVLSEVSAGDPAATLTAWTPANPIEPRWLERWCRADQAVTGALQAGLSDELSEPLVARRLGEWLDPETTLVVASSMPIRDVEEFFPAGRPLPRVLANRGANGIDGTVSTAFGIAAATVGPVVLLIGDVALAHDVGGLLAAGRLKLALTHRAA